MNPFYLSPFIVGLIAFVIVMEMLLDARGVSRHESEGLAMMLGIIVAGVVIVTLAVTTALAFLGVTL